MHVSIDQLLKVRDGAPVDADVLKHLDACASCAAELARVSRTREALRSLGQFEPPDAWRSISARASSAARSGRYRFKRAIAASVAFLAGFTALLLFLSSEEGTQTSGQQTAREVEPASPTQAERASMAHLVAQSRELEQLLRALPAKRVERVSTAATIDTLEQRIQWVDFQLSFAPDAGLSREQEERLWGERVHLMDSLVKVRYAAEAGRPSF